VTRKRATRGKAAKKRATSRRKTPVRRKKARPAKRSRKSFGYGRLLIGLLVLGLLLTGGYAVYLSAEVRVAFEGKRWAVPARVYARPLELYEGASLTREQLRHELEILGYRHMRRPAGDAQWGSSGGRFVIHTRAFRFWDGAQPALKLHLKLSDGVIDSLADDRGQPVDIARLEPAGIGSIFPAHREDRVLVQYEELPEDLVQALLAVEDRRFFEHHGVDPRGIARALWSNLRAGAVVEGGSTLTQQLVKNFILTPRRSLWRKINEALMALIVESRYDKDEILEAYANEVFLGQDGERAIHGFGLAARFYFNRPLQELRLHESALLVGLVKGASYYHPGRHPERALKRRNLVIRQMQEQGFLDAESAQRAQSLPLGISKRGRSRMYRYPAFIQLVRRQLRQDYRDEDLTSEGLQIFTTLDPWEQHVAARNVGAGLAAIEKSRGLKRGGLQAAMVIVSPQSGEIRALVGDRDAGFSGFNRALDAKRPIGSLAKVAVYLTALAQPDRYTLATLVRDEPVRLDLPNGQVWEPKNFDHKAHGRVPLHTALTRSFNLAAVNIGLDMGVAKVVDTLYRLGSENEIQPFPSVLLGAVPMSPLQVTQLYQTIAAGGFRAPLHAIREVMDARHQALQRYPLEVRRVLDPAAAYLLISNLQEVIRTGTGRGLSSYLDSEVGMAGKTGTTNDLRDSWFAGFSGDRVATVWVGRDDNKPSGLTGTTGALRVFGRVMRDLDPQPLAPLPPAGIAYHWVEESSGRLSAEGCKGALVLPFIHGSEPKASSDCVDTEERGLLERLFGL